MRKARESLKTALATTVTYGIALQMEWDQPHWAAFAVAFVSLANLFRVPQFEPRPTASAETTRS